MFGAKNVPNGVASGSPPAYGLRPCSASVWHPAQSAAFARYSPRATTSRSAATAGSAASSPAAARAALTVFLLSNCRGTRCRPRSIAAQSAGETRARRPMPTAMPVLLQLCPERVVAGVTAVEVLEGDLGLCFIATLVRCIQRRDLLGDFFHGSQRFGVRGPDLGLGPPFAVGRSPGRF